VAQGTISKIELGTKDISEDTVNRIATALKYPPSLFRVDEQYRGLGISVIFYRKRASTLQKYIRRLQATINILRIQAKAILRDVNLTTPNDIQAIDITEFPGTPADIAAMVRGSWKLEGGPIRNLIGTIENAGGVVFRFPFGTNDIDAISQWPDDTPPLFFVNAQAPADRARFSLAHELGHMVMHQNASETMELEANQFAAALLMPEVDIRSHLHDMSLQKASSMKTYWRVSMAAIMKRARDLECLSEQRYTSAISALHETRVSPERAVPHRSRRTQTHQEPDRSPHAARRVY
jgi:Zn-dependent peptidase ImmA (M78 family)/transcriptional regulator with XRE-family HTH domain